jgi:Tfp pilus assembly protein FimT
MHSIEKEEGITMSEILIVSMVIAVVIGITGAISTKFAERRSVDRITMNISSTIQIVKLKALRHGLEHQAAFAFNSGEKTLTIVTQRGNSNRGSDEYENETAQTIRVEEGIAIIPPNKTYNFNPNGTLGGTSGTVTIRPTTQNITRCGRIVVSPFGRIRVIQGNWDGTNCNAVK